MNRSIFAGDNRAVASVVGFIFVIGILVLLLAVYQVQVVPQQNAETELEHHENTRYELRSLHNAITDVSQKQSPRFQSIKLGTDYQPRTLAINPPPVAGTIRTEQHNISISNETGTTKNISTQFIEYQPGYNELDIGSTWYENSVLYLDERDRGNGVVVIEDQEIVDDDGNVTVIPLQNEFQETETGRVTLGLYPQTNFSNKTNFSNTTLPEEDGNYTVEIPTRLNGSEYWNEALGSTEVYNGVDNRSGDGEHHLLNLSVIPANLNVTPVGIHLEPEFSSKSSEESSEDGGGKPLDDENINIISNSDGNLKFTTINNEGETVTVTHFSVDATSIASNIRLLNNEEAEIKIEPQNGGQIGWANRTGGRGQSERYNADGTIYPLDQNAIINDRENVTISTPRIVRPGGGPSGRREQFNLNPTSNVGNADVIVTLSYENQDNQEFYFENIP